MGKPTCSVEGCERDSRTRGMCNTHYCRAWASGWVAYFAERRRGRV